MASIESGCSDEMTLNDFKMWSEEAVKHFLSVRKKNIEGDTETLIYRAMAAYEEKIPLDLQNPDNNQKYLYQELKDVIPNSCFIEMMEGTRKNKETESTTVLSPGIKESAQSFQIDITNL